MTTGKDATVGRAGGLTPRAARPARVVVDGVGRVLEGAALTTSAQQL